MADPSISDLLVREATRTLHSLFPCSCFFVVVV